jgi:hypothetical protein
LDEHGRFHHVVQRTPRRRENGVDVFEGPRRLLPDGVADDIAGLRVNRPLPGDVNPVAVTKVINSMWLYLIPAIGR